MNSTCLGVLLLSLTYTGLLFPWTHVYRNLKISLLTERTDTKCLGEIQHSDHGPESIACFQWLSMSASSIPDAGCGCTLKQTPLAQQTNCSFVPLTLVHPGHPGFLTECTDLCLSSVISSSSFYISASEILVPQRNHFATAWVSSYVSVFISHEDHLGHEFRTFYFLSCILFKLTEGKWYSSFL